MQDMPHVQDLVDILDGMSSLAIICHDNPDPDSIASALALQTIANECGINDTTIVYGGDITHQQNRTFVNILDVDLQNITDIGLDEYELLAFVDHAGRGLWSQLSADTSVDIVIDHHPTSELPSAPFIDVREDYGATASILAEYLRELDMDLASKLASALIFALHRERLDYIRHPTEHEYEAAYYACSEMDMPLIEQMYGSAFSPATLDAIGEAIQDRKIRGSTLVSSVGRTTERDALSQAADYLLNLEGISTVLVFGIVEDTIHLSARSVDPRVHVGEILDEAFKDVGSAGGHQDMAGGQIPLGIFADNADDDEELIEFVTTRVVTRFFETMHLDDEAEQEP